mgnify:FL=1
MSIASVQVIKSIDTFKKKLQSTITLLNYEHNCDLTIESTQTKDGEHLLSIVDKDLDQEVFSVTLTIFHDTGTLQVFVSTPYPRVSSKCYNVKYNDTMAMDSLIKNKFDILDEYRA